MDTVDIFDPNYVQKQQVANLRRLAAEQNALRVQTYEGQCSNWVQVNLRNRDVGVAISPVPVKPRKIVVSDDGEWTETAFDGLTEPQLPPPVTEPRKTAIAATTNIPPDRIDQLLAQNRALYELIARLIAKVGA